MIARRFPALAALALLGLTACTSTPSSRTVAEEVVDSLEGVPQAVKDCMTDRLEGYSNDELEVIGEANPNFSSANADMPMTPELEAFIADLAECTEGSAATAGDTAPDGTATDATGTGEPADDTTTATT